MIKKLKVNNFKTYANMEISFENMLSVITGKNNSGKTSVLEAFLIFQESYNHTLHEIKKKTSKYVKNNILNIGSIYFKETYIISFASVRSQDYYELFYQDNDYFNLEMLFDDDITLGFKISKARGGTAYQIKPSISDNDIKKLNTNYDISNFFYATKSSSIYAINQYEPIYSPKMIEKLSFEGNKQSVFRNKLLKLKDKLLLEKLETYIETIFGYEKFSLSVEFNHNEDLYIKSYFTIKNEQKQDIALLGSGTLQIIEVLVNLLLVDNYKNKVILLDEPDSHLHRDIQKVLMQRLRDYSKNGLQILVTTHNEQIISLSNLDEILHLYSDKDKTIVEPISKQLLKGRQFGFINQKDNIYKDLGVSSKTISFIEAIESDKIIIIEGKDKQYIEALEKKRRELFLINNIKNKVIFWSLNGVSSLDIKMDKIKSMFELIKNKQNLWSKTNLLIDRDFRLDNELPKYKGIDTISWNGYTIESIFLDNINPFKKYIFDILKVEDRNKFDEIFNNLIAEYSNVNKYKDKISKQRDHDYNLKNSIAYIDEISSRKNKLHLLVGKKELTDMIEKLYTSLNIKFELSLEELLLNYIDSLDVHSWNADWNSILQSVYGE